jgi:ribosomal protein S18 acetylase RimI-like enzyme
MGHISTSSAWSMTPNDILLHPDANGALMITISRLEEASDAAVKDINLLLPQVRSDPSQHKGSLSDLQNIVENDWTSMIVAKDAERIIGMATVHIVNNMGKRIAHIDDVVVDDAYRWQGLGKKIIDEVINVAKAKDVSQLRLTSRSARIAANKLYQLMGFEIGNTNVYVMKL